MKSSRPAKKSTKQTTFSSPQCMTEARDRRHELFGEWVSCSWLVWGSEGWLGHDYWSPQADSLASRGVSTPKRLSKCQSNVGGHHHQHQQHAWPFWTAPRLARFIPHFSAMQPSTHVVLLHFVYRGCKCSLFLISRVMMTKISIPQVSFHRLTDEFCWLLSHYERCSYFLSWIILYNVRITRTMQCFVTW